jgi:hypothetical protein
MATDLNCRQLDVAAAVQAHLYYVEVLACEDAKLVQMNYLLRTAILLTRAA